MPHVYADRVKDTASSVSGSTVTLSNSPPTGFQSFNSGIGDGKSVVYCMFDGSGNWEVNFGVYTNSGTTLARFGTPIASSNSGNQVSSFSGTVTVVGDEPAAAINQMNWVIGSGRIYTNAFIEGCSTAAAAVSVNNVFYVPIWVREWFTSAVIHFNINVLASVTSTIECAIYDSLGITPNNRLVTAQTGIVSGNQGGGATGDIASSSFTMPRPMPPGLYYAAIVVRTGTTSLTMRTISNITSSSSRTLLGATDSTDATQKTGWTQATASALPSTATPTIAQAVLFAGLAVS